MLKKICFLLLAASWHVAQSQQTVGLFTQTSGSEDGYILFAPIGSTTTYLIDKCGKEIHTWSSAYKPGLSAYLLADGTLLRTGTDNNSTFTDGGSGGEIQRINWSSNVLWSYKISDDSECQHHDVCYLPNGNILAICWENKTTTLATDAGREPSLLGTSLWSEKIVELQPVGTDSANIVWEWHLWDHLVQDYDNSKANYGVVADHPELLNINYTTGQATNSDWIHMNSIDYNPQLDEILVSSHNLDEVWVIDHSTTTAQAATHSGGTHNKGGDFLYRWGNPVVYGAGTTADQQLYGQHYAHWIIGGLTDSGDIMIFNNGAGRPAGDYSSIDLIAPPVDGSGNYSLTTGQAYGPTSETWTYVADTPTNFFSMNLGSGQRLSNGNTLICNATSGQFFEIDTAENIVWDYVNPVGNTGPISQGTTPTNNSAFRCTLYEPSYSGFSGQTLTPGSPIELNPLAYNCSTTGIAIINKNTGNTITASNPFDDDIVLISAQEVNNSAVTLISISGAVCERWNNVNIGLQTTLPTTNNITPGMYILNIKNGTINTNIKLVKEP